MARAPRKEQAGRLAAITLDEASLGSSTDDIEHERRVAIYDLIEENSFRPVGPRRRALFAYIWACAATGWCSTSA